MLHSFEHGGYQHVNSSCEKKKKKRNLSLNMLQTEDLDISWLNLH